MTDNKVIKYFLFPILLIAIFFLIRIRLISNNEAASTGAIILSLIAIALLIKKKSLYIFENDGIFFTGIIKRKIYYDEIIEIRRIYYDELGIGMKFGSRMPGSSIGIFYFDSIGEVIMNTNNDNTMILIKTPETQIIISPDNPDEFISKINSMN